MMVSCAHATRKRHGRDRLGNPRWRCLLCGKTWIEAPARPLGKMQVPVPDAKRALHMLVEGSSIRATERVTGIARNTLCKLVVYFGQACRRFLDQKMRGLKLDHLQFDEQWTFVFKKQARLTIEQRQKCNDMGDIYLWTCIDQQTKLMPAFRVGKRSADNARRFALDVASRLVWPKPHESDNHAFAIGKFRRIVQVSSDAFAGYPEAIDMAFGPYVKYGTIIKQYRNAKMVYTPSEMVGTKRTPRKNMSKAEARTICTSHVERLNGTQRLFMKRLNRLTMCFSKKLANLEAAFSIFAAYYNFCWRTRQPGKSGKLRGSAAMMAGLAGHPWTFDELFDAVLRPATQL